MENDSSNQNDTHGISEMWVVFFIVISLCVGVYIGFLNCSYNMRADAVKNNAGHWVMDSPTGITTFQWGPSTNTPTPPTR